MGRKILFVTTDQQRFDALGCNGGEIARTPVADRLAATGINYRRAMNQNVVCMPARSTMITGQYPRTHGVYANGVPLPADAPSVAAYLNEHGYRTGLFGKAHFEPGMDLEGKWPENRLARERSTGPHRGFEHLELAMHGPLPLWHYGVWIREQPGRHQNDFYPLFGADGLNGMGGGETGACQLKVNPVPKEMYHTDWVADRTISWLDSLGADEDWFCWMSFPDPHHPWDPPESELGRVSWRDLDLPAGHPGSPDACRRILEQKPKHWLAYYEGWHSNLEGGPPDFVPAAMTHDQVREINAFTHVENELVDEALGRVLKRIDERGWGDDVDVIFTTDHGELQGDFGLLFKGPYHCDALMRLPMIWRPAPSAGVAPGVVTDPVGQLDLAPTFCRIAGLPVPGWVEGAPLPTGDGQGRERVITEWESQFDTEDLHLRSLYRDGWVVTEYGVGGGYDGSEGELYDLGSDPHQWVNRWDDPALQSFRGDLLADLRDHLPAPRDPRLLVEAPV
ncbi:MAG TPA: sulfatase-like hydrolase/transferase [Acidimicrobiales bacterium]|jgi:arylsulfatase A-like enzyme|nr:sulfatase-like hydrolase/transferase [Acidimicrobiales bacterium]